MDEALLSLLEKKDFSYITVKEICAAAGVNRSTFYLHYETMSDLLSECTQYMNERFLSYIQHDSGTFLAKLSDCPLHELYLITPEYLTPYLSYIKANQRLFRTGIGPSLFDGVLYHKNASFIGWRFFLSLCAKELQNSTEFEQSDGECIGIGGWQDYDRWLTNIKIATPAKIFRRAMYERIFISAMTAIH